MNKFFSIAQMLLFLPIVVVDIFRDNFAAWRNNEPSFWMALNLSVAPSFDRRFHLPKLNLDIEFDYFYCFGAVTFVYFGFGRFLFQAGSLRARTY